MRLIKVETLELETFVGDNIPPYAILSHTWGADGKEVSYHDIETRKIEERGNGSKKLKGCCNQAKKDGLGYAWIDTCCIDKTNSVELGEAINSMFRWYKEASICYVYLSDVPSGESPWDQGSKFFSSRWFRRGWTLQELLAPENLQFYDQTWTSIGTKRKRSGEIETITGIPRRFLLGWEKLHDASVAQRMSWAAKRETTRKEDIAYCLLGIFRISMPIIYGGDGDQAFSRLQEEIMKKLEDDSILAWGLNLAESIPSKSADVVSAGILATAPSDFANCGRIVLRQQDATPINTFDISGGRLRVHLSLHITSAGEIYGLLNCGPEHNTEQVVGIPLHKAVSGAQSDDYLRPQGHHLVLHSKTTSIVSTKVIHIRIERQSRAHEATSRRYWLSVEGHKQINLKLTDVHPSVRWENDRAMIAKTNDSDENIRRRYLARFRTQGEGSRDVIVMLEFEIQGLQAQAQCHVMTSSRETALEDLSHKLIHIRPEAFGKQTASNSNLNVKVTVKEEQVAQEPMFVVRLARASSSPEATVDATLELQRVDLKLELVKILQEKDPIRLETERLGQQKDQKMATLDLIRERLTAVQEHLRKLGEEKTLLIDELEKETQQVNQLTNRRNEVRQQQEKLSRRELEIQRRLDELDTKQGPGNWLETTIKTLLDKGKIDCRLKDVGDSDSDRPQLSRAVESGHNISGQTPLSWAATNGHEAIAKLLLENGADLESNKENGRTPLWVAVATEHEAVAKLLLEKGADLESKDNNGNTLLSLAAASGHEAAAKLLLKNGADLESRNEYGNTPLSLAIYNSHEAMAKLLLEKGADLESRDKSGNTLLSLAVASSHEAMAKLLLENGADLESRDKCGKTPLSLAASSGHEAITKLLLEKGADLESKDNRGKTPLLWATENGREAVAKLLLEKGADLEPKNKDGSTRLSVAAESGHEAVVKLLLEKGVDLESKNKDGSTRLSVAAENGHEAVVKLLLEKGADLESKNKDCRTPLLCAAYNGHEAVAKLLLKKGADLESKDNRGRAPLLWAAYNGHEAVVKLLLEKGADLELKDNEGRTPLLWAACNGHEAVAKLLLEKGADLESKDIKGRTPLLCAACNGHEAVAKLLLEKGVDLESKDKDGNTPLLWAAYKGHKTVAKLLLEKSADLESKDNEGGTPLLSAVYNGHEAVVKLLLEKGADLESKDKGDNTPLLWAAYNGHEAVAKLLLEEGADLESKDSEGKTPLSWATKKGHRAVAKLLLQKGARKGWRVLLHR